MHIRNASSCLGLEAFVKLLVVACPRATIQQTAGNISNFDLYNDHFLLLARINI